MPGRAVRSLVRVGRGLLSKSAWLNTGDPTYRQIL
jgi:hypothetical protein